MLVLAFRDVEAGKLDLEGRRVVGPQDLRNGTGVLKNFEPGLQPTWGDLLTQMIITSDNTATDIVVDRVGFERVNDLLGELGYTGTRLQHTLAGYFRRRWELLDPANASLSNAEASARGNLSLAVQGGAAPGSRPGPGASEGLRRKATAIR